MAWWLKHFLAVVNSIPESDHAKNLHNERNKQSTQR